MRKALFIIASAMFVFLCGCSGVSTTSNNQEPTTVYTMEARNISVDFEEPAAEPKTTEEFTESTSTEPTQETTQTETTTTEETVPVTETSVVEATEMQYTLPEPETVAVQTAVLQYATYTVQEGDWLCNIARKYGVDMYTLAQFNNMSIEDTILPGDILLIPDGYTMQEDYSYTEPTYDEPENSYVNPVYSHSDGLVQYGCDTKYSWTAGWASFYNMSVACDVLTNEVAYIPPGGSFSWLRDVGPCTGSPYVESSGYSGGQVVQVYGGGICMTASALKVAAMNAGCVITETHPHSMPVTYNDRSNPDWQLYESAIDASGCDLCFYNPSSTTGLTIRAYTDINNGTCMVELIPDLY